MRIKCKLCDNDKELEALNGADSKKYILCSNCHIIFALTESLPQPSFEKSRYELHNNTPDNEGYVNFLTRAIDVVAPFIQSTDRVLDYGCGPGPVLAREVEKRFHCKCHVYDPFFFDLDIEDHAPYDIVFSTEVFEHFHHPDKSIRNVLSILRSGGLLCIMTELYKDSKQFETWYYTKDETHVAFYHKKTLLYFEERYGLELIHSDDHRVHLFKKNET